MHNSTCSTSSYVVLNFCSDVAFDAMLIGLAVSKAGLPMVAALAMTASNGNDRNNHMTMMFQCRRSAHEPDVTQSIVWYPPKVEMIDSRT